MYGRESMQDTGVRAYSVGSAPAKDTRRLYLNEFRYSHPPEVVDALRTAVTTVSVEDLLTNYQSGPDPELANDLARFVGAPSGENVLLMPGSDEVLRAIIDTSRLRGHKVVLTGTPGYTHFEHFARLKPLEIIAYPIGLGTSAADLEASLRYYDDELSEGCLVYMCSPNNPTGDMWSARTVGALAKEYPNSLFLVDEAYVEFASLDAEAAGGEHIADDAAALNSCSLVATALTHANVVVTRTLSKAFGLAAMRIGYAVGLAPIIASIATASSPKAFGAVPSRVARAALRNLAHYRACAIAARREARVSVAALRARGWWVFDTPANFYLVHVGDVAATTALLEAGGVRVRDRDSLPGLAGFVRLTAGTADDTAAVLAGFAQLLPPAPAIQTLYTSKGTVAAVKSLMKQTLLLLDTASVDVWAQGGTMLGMIRHGGMIPWDDDGDLAYLRHGDDDPLEELVSTFAAAKLTLQRNRTNTYWQVGTNASGDVISPVHVDVFSYRPVKSASGVLSYELEDERFRQEEPESKAAHCNTQYSSDELFTLVRSHRFYDQVILMPAKSDKVLKRALGADYMTQAKVRTADGAHATYTLRDTSPA